MNHSILIVVPTLNSHALLPTLIQSLQSQTCADWNLLFVDGNSSSYHRQWLDNCCSSDTRCRWVEQDSVNSGIFGAMNLGFSLAAPDEWVLFWGSDDWAAAPDVFEKFYRYINSVEYCPDMVVCKGRYASPITKKLGRSSVFRKSCFFTTYSFKWALFLGSTPPHQATFFGPGIRSILAHYSPRFKLAADLDYYLKLLRYPSLRIQSLDLELVHMGDRGISGQSTKLRITEVYHAYFSAFGWIWWLPFLFRYLVALLSY